MYIAPKPLTESTLDPEILKADKTYARKYDGCAVGDKALYLEAFTFNCRRYIPFEDVERVFKRLAVSKGFFEQGKIYGTIAYLVVLHSGGKETKVKFDIEEQLDLMLSDIKNNTSIPVGKK